MKIVTKMLGAVLLLFFASVHGQVAPGDEDANCMMTLSPYDENVMMLMNSRHYLQLLDEPGAVWDTEDYDDNNNDDLYNPTSFQHNAGDRCRWILMSCGYPAGFQNNWLFTQFISKTVPGQTNYNISITIDITYILSSCRARYNCNPEISVFKFDTSGPQPRSVYTDRSNYKLLINNKPGTSTRAQTILLNVDILPEVEGFYLAIKDNTSCIQIAQLQVYRYQCPQKQEGLVIFPETAAPPDEDLIVNVQCMPNASPITSVSVICNATGYWHGSAQCECDPGYIRKNDSEENDFCEACPAGSYRSADDPEDECKPCPANTMTNVVAAGVCQCLTDFFRNQNGLNETCPENQAYEDVSFDCTKPPSRPIDLQADETTKNSISISWSPPSFLGYRKDLYYTVEHSHPFIPGVMLPALCGNDCLIDTNCTISSLHPATTYAIQVTAHNGVSDQDRDGAFGRQVKITLQTEIAPPTAPPNVYHTCDIKVIVWDKPLLPNGNISRYDIEISFGNGSNITVVEHKGQNSYYLSDILFYPPELYEVKVRAVNEAGPGSYTISTPLDCFNGSDGLISGEDEATDLVTCPVPSPSPVLDQCPTTVTVSDTTTETFTVTTTSTLPVTTTVVASTTLSTTVVVPTTVTSTDTVTSTVTTTKTVPVPTTVTSTASITATVTETEHIPTTVTRTATVTTTDIVTVPTTTTVEVPTTVTTTATVTDHITATTTAIVTTTTTTTLSATPTPCPTVTPDDTPTVPTSEVPQLPTMLPTCPDPEPCDSCCQPCEECTSCEPDIIQTTCPPPTTCPTCEPHPVCPSCPSFTFHASPDCAKRDRRPGDVRNVQMLDCGMIVWDAPEDVDCCHDIITYKIKFYNGTTYRTTDPSQRGIMYVSNSWVKLTAVDLPTSRPLHIVIRSKKEDGVQSPNWVEAATLTDSYVMDCVSDSN